jgi:hypothetical protein
MAGMDGNRSSRRRGRNLLAMAACVLGILVPVPSALGQAAVDQYIPSPDPANSGKNAGDPGAITSAPGGDTAPGSKAGKKDQSADKVAPSGASDSGSSGGGDVPGTDFPLTPVAAAIGGTLLLGLIAALAFNAVQRRRRVAGTR